MCDESEVLTFSFSPGGEKVGMRGGWPIRRETTFAAASMGGFKPDRPVPPHPPADAGPSLIACRRFAPKRGEGILVSALDAEIDQIDERCLLRAFRKDADGVAGDGTVVAGAFDRVG